jgi:hypothetical protein
LQDTHRHQMQDHNDNDVVPKKPDDEDWTIQQDTTIVTQHAGNMSQSITVIDEVDLDDLLILGPRLLN